MKFNKISSTVLLIIFFVSTIQIPQLLAQGGPPLLTDDSGVPGHGKWENNFAFEFIGSKNEYEKAFPILDLNYGVGDKIQLKAQLTWIAEKGEKLANKFDNLTLGFKYMIFDEKKDGVSLSVYPQPIISWNSEEVTNPPAVGILLPAAINKEIAGIGVNLQVGYQRLDKNSQFIIGLVLDHDFGKFLTVLGELFSTIGRTTDEEAGAGSQVFFKEGTFFDIGAQIKLTDTYTFLAAIGKDIESPHISSDDANFYGYIGLQLNM